MSTEDELEAEIARLQAEVERLEPELEQRCRELNLSLAQQAVQLRQIGELEAEVERLRKAGDAMAKELPMIADTHLSDEVWVRMQTDWERAKEGKPSV